MAVKSLIRLAIESVVNPVVVPNPPYHNQIIVVTPISDGIYYVYDINSNTWTSYRGQSDKTFLFIIYEFRKQTRVFAPGTLYRPGLMYASKAGVYPSIQLSCSPH
jgi:hypothetical protein